MTDPRCTRCQHPESEHRGMSGPNSIGQWHYGWCYSGWATVGPYLVHASDSCDCPEFRPHLLRRIAYRIRGHR